MTEGRGPLSEAHYPLSRLIRDAVFYTVGLIAGAWGMLLYVGDAR